VIVSPPQGEATRTSHSHEETGLTKVTRASPGCRVGTTVAMVVSVGRCGPAVPGPEGLLDADCAPADGYPRPIDPD
jgi:hypothetical protein